MTSPAVAAEMQAVFERDKKAFESLSSREQKVAAITAGIGFGARQGIVNVGGLIIDILEGAFNLVVRAPLAWAWDKTAKLADNTASAPTRLATAAARGGLSVAKAGVWLAGKGMEALRAAGLAGDHRMKFAELQDKLDAKREKTAVWGKLRQEKQAKDWKKKKSRMRKALGRAGGFLEYHGAIGLYRAFKWLLDPRRPGGKPLLGNEKLNKAVGFVAAAAMFGVLTYQLSKFLVLGKILHIKLAQTLVTSTAPLWVNVLQQTVLHPAITIGLTALKFVTLPVIAAARGRLKNYDFTQGVAYAYKAMLNDHREDELKRAFNREAKYAPKEDDPKWQAFRKKAGAMLHKESLSFIRSFFRHIVEKASPEFYEVRHRHYTELHAQRQKAKAEQKVRKSVMPIPAPTPQPGPLANLPGLGQAFDVAQNPPPPVVPPVVPPAPAAP